VYITILQHVQFEYYNTKYEKTYFKTLKEKLFYVIRYWTPCRSRLTILLLNGLYDGMWRNPTWIKS